MTLLENSNLVINQYNLISTHNEAGVYILPYTCPNGTGMKLTYLSIHEGNKPMKKIIKESEKNT